VVDLRADAETPLDASVRREGLEALEREIARLPTAMRMPLVLKDIVELPVTDVAAVLGLKPATVKTRVHRARLRLRQALARTLPRRDAPPPAHATRICLDLLNAKQEAIDRGVAFRVPPGDLCERCQAMFATLDLGVDLCHELGNGRLSPSVRRTVEAALASDVRVPDRP